MTTLIFSFLFGYLIGRFIQYEEQNIYYYPAISADIFDHLPKISSGEWVYSNGGFVIIRYCRPCIVESINLH